MAEQVVQTHQLGTGLRDGSRFLRDDGTWSVPSGGGSGSGGSGALVPLQVIGPLTAAQSTLSFGGIPQTGYKHLRLAMVLRGTAAATIANVLLQCNSDSGSNYDYVNLESNSSANSSTGVSATTSFQAGIIPAATSRAAAAGQVEISILNYNGTAFEKTIHASSNARTGSVVGSLFFDTCRGFWRNSAAVGTLTLTLSTGNFEVGSYACLYGEMDTAGPLLTPASNLLAETVLMASQASILIPNIPQGYRDLRVEMTLRGDTAATLIGCNVRLNSDAGSNYLTEKLTTQNTTVTGSSTTTTSADVGSMTAGSATANSASEFVLYIPNYSAGTFFKNIHSLSGGGQSIWLHHGSTSWVNAGPVSSLTVFAATGNLVAGSVVRIYGEPAAAGGSSYGTGTRLRVSSNQSIVTATATPIAWDAEDSDADNQHYTSAAALTGTVTKAAASPTLTGSSTLFTSELSVGQVISVPGTAAEVVVVIGIASDTSLTVAVPFANSASSQTATRVNSAVVFRQPGFYALELGIYSASLASGNVSLAFRLNGSTIIGQNDEIAIAASSGYVVTAQRPFQQWDYVEALWTQNSGGSVNVLADERTHWSISSRPTVTVAIPYVNVQDRKTLGTNGGTFTSGADRTRDLNTIVSNTGGIASLSSNQLTLPAGQYRYRIECPAFACDFNQALLYNVTDSVEIGRGRSQRTSGATSNISTVTGVSGRFVISATKVLEVRHRCSTTRNTDGFGTAASFGTEVYTTAEFWKEG